MAVIIVGVGNVMYGDDALGPVFVEALKTCGYKGYAVTSDGGMFYIASLLEGKERAVFIDILSEEYGKPGDVVKLRVVPSALSEEEYAILASRETSPHTVTPAHIVGFAYASGLFDGEAMILGIVSNNVGFAKPLSKTVRESVGRLCSLLESELGEEIDCRCIEERFKENASKILDPRKAL